MLLVFLLFFSRIAMASVRVHLVLSSALFVLVVVVVCCAFVLCCGLGSGCLSPACSRSCCYPFVLGLVFDDR